MPYATNNDLPDAVKKALPGEAQTIFRKAFNGASGDDEARTKIAWGVVKKSWKKDGEKWVKLSKPKLHEFDAEVFSVGTWNGDKYNEADLDNMVANFNALGEAIKPPIKLGHNDKQKKLWSDGQPALGWVKGLKRVGTKLIATLSSVPDVVHKAIKSGLYKRVSSEIYWNYKHSGNVYKRVLSAVALLGADIPAVSNLEDLQAFLSQSTDKRSGSFDKAVAYSFDVDGAGIIKTDTKKEKELSDMEAKEYQERIAKAEANAKAEKERADKAEADKKAYEKKVEAKRLEEKKKVRFAEVKAYCEQMVKDGRMLPAQRDLIVSDKHNYSDDDYVFAFDTFKKFADLSGIVVEFNKEHANDKDKNKKKYANVSEEVAAKVKEYMEKHPNTDYVDASSAVLADNPELAKAYVFDGEGGGE